MRTGTRSLAIGAAGLVIAAGVIAARSWRATDQVVSTTEPEALPDAAVVPWCAGELEAIPGGGCFAAPPNVTAATPLLVYLHGRFERSAVAEEMDRQRRVAQRATKRGFAVLALRGREGQCLEPELATWVCWPASERTAAIAPDVVQGFGPAIRHAEARLAARSSAASRTPDGGAAPPATPRPPRYVLGFSSGGFFTSIVASRALLDADAFVIAHAGPIEPMHPVGKKPPILLLSADDDVPTQDDMMRLDDELSRDQWPHDGVAREGVHGLPDEDIDAALAFLTRMRSEALPLKPPISKHVPLARDPRRRAEIAAAREAGAPPAHDVDPAAPAGSPGQDDPAP